MGNCQAAEAATVVIQHPGNKVERIYWSVSAQDIMTSNPGHYVALIVTSPTATSGNGTPLKQLKLLRPGDTLVIGQVYRLISFEDVLKELAAKRGVKLGKLLKEKGRLGLEKGKDLAGPTPTSTSDKPVNATEPEIEHGVYRLGSSGGGRNTTNRGMGRHHGGVGQWKPALQSIAEIGT